MEADWSIMEHAYGSAENIPELLEQLKSFPTESSYDQEPWFTLWSSLCHQGDIYSASLAALPVVASIAETAPDRVTLSFFALPTSIEIARVKSGTKLAEETEHQYKQALHKLARCAIEAISSQTNEATLQAALAVMAVASGQHQYAEFILEVPESEVSEVIEWYQSH